MTLEESFIDFKCPYCAAAVSFPAEAAGKIEECPECAEILIVPQGNSEHAHKIPIPITTPRLILRRLDRGDWKDLLEFMSDEELVRYSERPALGEVRAFYFMANGIQNRPELLAQARTA